MLLAVPITVLAVFAVITPYDWGDSNDVLLACQYGAVVFVGLIALALRILSQVTHPRLSVPTSAWLALVALVWSLAGVAGSPTWWKALSLAGSCFLSAALVVLEVRHYLRSR